MGSPVDIIYLDFQKAFDKVPHQRLLLKLKAHGIGDSITDWIEQWLTDRRQRVVVDGEVSNWKSVLSGVPQGSVLGPIVFLIYINDLDNNITSNVLKFADDTKLFRKVNTDGDKQHLQKDLDTLVKWSEKLQMLLNFGCVSLLCVMFPFEWKEANSISLCKKGSRNKSENYRPLSLTSVICKLLERLIKDHIVDFLVKHTLLNSSQHGFLKARSCLTNMLCFLEEITKWIDVGSPVDIIYLDFQKAFDKVPYQRLLLKLKAHGIGVSITDWIEQWLTDRRQRVVEVSNWKSDLSEVPQGSVLGPILF